MPDDYDLTYEDYRRAFDILEAGTHVQAIVDAADAANRLHQLVFATIDGFASIFDQVRTRHLDGEPIFVTGEWCGAIQRQAERVFASPEELVRFESSEEAKNDDRGNAAIVIINRAVHDDDLATQTLTESIQRGRIGSFIAALIDLCQTAIPELTTSDKAGLLSNLAARWQLGR